MDLLKNRAVLAKLDQGRFCRPIALVQACLLRTERLLSGQTAGEERFLGSGKHAKRPARVQTDYEIDVCACAQGLQLRPNPTHSISNTVDEAGGMI